MSGAEIKGALRPNTVINLPTGTTIAPRNRHDDALQDVTTKIATVRTEMIEHFRARRFELAMQSEATLTALERLLRAVEEAG